MATARVCPQIRVGRRGIKGRKKRVRKDFMEDITKKILEIIIKALVNQPDKVKIERKTDEMGVLFRVFLARGDEGTVIGKRGRNIQAIRKIVSAVGTKNKQKAHIKLEVPAIPSKRRDGAVGK